MLVHFKAIGDYCILGRTIDDAAGEAFDKVGRLLGLPYPGGPEIERHARQGDPTAFRFPRSYPNELDFSFSGLKTSVLYTLQKLDDPAARLDDLSASFQQAVIEVLAKRAVQAARRTGTTLVTLSGGVSCNQALRKALTTTCADAGLAFRSCPPAYSTDNAAMIAFAAWHHLRLGASSPLDEDIDPNLSLVSGSR
jgi:N6-L-threonylcarbamoyladenine synthase